MSTPNNVSDKKISKVRNYAFIDSQNLNLEVQFAFLNNLKNKLEYKKTRPERPGCF